MGKGVGDMRKGVRMIKGMRVMGMLLGWVEIEG